MYWWGLNVMGFGVPINIPTWTQAGIWGCSWQWGAAPLQLNPAGLCRQEGAVPC